MNRKVFVIFAPALGLVLALGIWLQSPAPVGLTFTARADIPAQPYPAIKYEHHSTQAPSQDVQVVRIDLSHPDVDVRVSRGGADPDGEGEYQTTLQTLSTIAERERFDVAINGDFFSARQTVDIEGAKSGYVAGKWGKVNGPAVTDGLLWGPAQEPRASLILDAQKRPRLAMIQEVPADALQVIAGSHIIVQDGKVVVQDKAGFVRTRHPRTAVGIADNGKTLVLAVVDGRSEKSVGMGLIDLATFMMGLGCRDVLNLDGGGSSEMLVRDPASGKLQVMNSPSDGRERAVANVLGVTIRGARRIPGVN